MNTTTEVCRPKTPLTRAASFCAPSRHFCGYRLAIEGRVTCRQRIAYIGQENGPNTDIVNQLTDLDSRLFDGYGIVKNVVDIEDMVVRGTGPPLFIQRPNEHLHLRL